MKKRISIGIATVLLIMVELAFWPGYLAHDFFGAKVIVHMEIIIRHMQRV